MSRRPWSRMRVLLCIVIAAQALAPAVHRLALHGHGGAGGPAYSAAAAPPLAGAHDAGAPAPAAPGGPAHDHRDCPYCSLATAGLPEDRPASLLRAPSVQDAPVPAERARPQLVAWSAAFIRGPPLLQVI